MITIRARIVAGLAGIGVLVPALALSQPEIPLSSRVQPKPVPVADTRLLMEGLANANYKGLERLLATKLEDTEGWTFARGQALLIAETGNLLLLRPPKNQGLVAWNKSAVELREAATNLARATAERDLTLSRARLVEVANVCNKCHQTFQVAASIKPFEAEKKPAPVPPPPE